VSSGVLEAVLGRAQDLGFLGPGPVQRQVTHALEMAACVPADARRVLDLGSGGGVPGLVLAEARPEISLVLLDAGRRRCRFLREATEELGLTGRVEVVEDRAESAARRPELRDLIDVVVARSFGPPPVTAECAVGFLRLGGRLVVSEPPADEGGSGRWVDEALETLGLTPPRRGGGPGGSFVWFEKRRADERWPRRVGIPAKRPLWDPVA
jgi:16S rRNA (guanine527-N7)-methyltransferase